MYQRLSLEKKCRKRLGFLRLLTGRAVTAYIQGFRLAIIISSICTVQSLLQILLSPAHSSSVQLSEITHKLEYLNDYTERRAQEGPSKPYAQSAVDRGVRDDRNSTSSCVTKERLLVETWRYNGSHASGRDPRLAPLTCRLYNSCVMPNGTLYVLDTLRKADAFLQHCGASGIHYVDWRTFQSLRHRHYLDLDLISPDTITFDEHDFTFLSQAMRIIMSHYVVLKSWSTRSVNYQQYSKNGDRVHSTCSENTSAPFKPCVVAADSIENLYPFEKSSTQHWKSKLLSFIHNSVPDSQFLTEREVFVKNSGVECKQQMKPACFRSIILTGERGNQIPPALLERDNPFFLSNSLKRDNRWPDRMNTHKTVPLNENFPQCIAPGCRSRSKATITSIASPKISLLKKQTTFSLRIAVYEKRLVRSDIDRVLKSLQLALQRRSVSSIPRLQVDYFNDSTAAGDIISVVKELDVYIAASGSALSYTLYMRKKSVVVEILPFSVALRYYAHFAEQMDIVYSGHMALPDTDTFKQCVSRYGIDSHSVQNLINAWENAAEEFKNGDRRSYLKLHLENSHWSKQCPEALSCAAQQRHLQIRRTQDVFRAIYDRAVVPRLR